MQAFHHSKQQASNNNNYRLSAKQKRDIQKKGIIQATAVQIFILVQILVYNRGKNHLSSLKEEINDLRNKHVYVSLKDIKTITLPQKGHIPSANNEIDTTFNGELSNVHEKEEQKIGDTVKKKEQNRLRDENIIASSLFQNEHNANKNNDTIVNENNNKEKEQLSDKNKKKPLNIVLLYADDWRHDTFGAAGNPVIKTPNLDVMAKEGMIFTENCVTTLLCWISRTTLQTGQYLSRYKSLLVTDAVIVRKAWNETYNYLLRKMVIILRL